MVSEQSKCEVPIRRTCLRHAGKARRQRFVCSPPSFIFSKRQAPTAVNSERSRSGPEMESGRRRYFRDGENNSDACETWMFATETLAPRGAWELTKKEDTDLPAPLSSGRGSRCAPPQPPWGNREHWSYWSSGSSACPL